MHRVIYADVLVLINVYITYFLLKSTAVLTKSEPDRGRLFLVSLMGGAYSLTVLLPEKIQPLLAAIRLPVAIIFVLVAFGYSCLRAFVRLNLSFMLCSFIFAGLMLALWYFVCPEGMYFNGSVVYFDINVLTLAVLTVVCYVFLRLFEKLFRTRAPVNTVFECTVHYKGEQIKLKAFLDTGNSLTDHFTGKPVMIASRMSLVKLFPESIRVDDALTQGQLRFIFCNTLQGEGLLAAFSPEKVEVKGADCSFFTDRITVALTEKKLLQGEYDAILPVGMLDIINERKDDAFNEEVSVTV